MHRVAIKIDPLAEHLLADARLAVLPRQCAAALIGISRIEGAGEKSEQIRHRLWLEDYRVHAGLDRFRLLRSYRLADRFAGDACRVESREVEMIAGVVSRARAIGAAR